MGIIAFGAVLCNSSQKGKTADPTPLFEFTEKKQPVSPEMLQVPLSVSELTQQVRSLIETQFESVWVVGQVSTLTYHRSGHVYFTLKDEGAQLPAVVWKTSVSKIKFKLKDGMEIVCRGRLTVFPPQGKYQMVISELQPKGIGTLELAFQQLREKLAAEGLFQPARKKPLPDTIRRVAVITSPTGAAVKDFLQILGRRTKLIDVLIVPAKVQGDGAAEEVAEAIQRVNQWNGIDWIVVTRGGGSMEDLWAFNEEVLVRAVAASAIPVVSGVGHEIDVTLCDFAADIRAATPSEAAERISREDSGRRRELLQMNHRLNDFIDRQLRIASEKLKLAMRHPIFRRPEQMLEARRYRLDLCGERLDRLMDHRLQSQRDRLGNASASLEALSPLSILSRGYTLTEMAEGRLIRRAGEVNIGDTLRTRFADGVVESQCVDKKRSTKRKRTSSRSVLAYVAGSVEICPSSTITRLP
jgi:exodeoxyribonuclease VII large subunit